MDLTLRAVVIGIGNKGWKGWIDELYPQELTHVGSILKTKGLQLISVADTSKEILHQFHDWNINESITVAWSEDGEIKTDEAIMGPVDAYSNYQEMLNDVKPDVVTIATPVETHANICRNVMRFDSVKAILLEKPIANNLEDAKKILLSAKNFNIPVVVNQTRRWHPAWKYARKKILELGHCFSIVGYCNGDPLDAGVHMADLFNWLAPHGNHHYIDLYQGGSHGGKYQPYLVFEVEAFCPRGRIGISCNGTVVAVGEAGPSKIYRNLNEVWWRPDSGSILYDYNKSNIEAQLACMAEVRDLALGKRKRPTCGLGEGFRALEACLRWAQ